MRNLSNRRDQAGVALGVAMIFLLIVTIIGVVAARNSTFSLKMSGNLQDLSNSLQSAEAGALAVLSLANTGNDPFRGGDTEDPFDGVSPNPLDNLNDAGAVDTDVTLMAFESGCPRQRRSSNTSEVWGTNTTVCDYYRVDAEHDVAQRARTRVSLGVIKRVLKP